VDLTPHVQQLSSRLEAAAPDEATEAVVHRLIASLEPALQLQVLDILGVAALELSDQLPEGHVELRLAGQDAQLLYVEDTSASTAPRPPDDDGSAARITLRLPEALKGGVEAAAARTGQSTNAWLVQAVRQALEGGRGPGRPSRSGTRFSGYASS
jgi:predicted HicB family RNase H-like nuclease